MIHHNKIKEKGRLLQLLGVGLCVALFTASATTDLTLPGPQSDECVHAILAIDLLRPPHPFGQYALRLGDQPLPFGVDPHTGALKAYFLWPFFSLFGPSVEGMRLLGIFFGLLTLVFCYLCIRLLFGPWPAFWGLLLLSADSSLIFYSKLDVGPIVEQLMWIAVGFWAFTQWSRTEKLFYLLLGLTAVVLGVYSHIAFVWVLIASVFAIGCVNREEIKKLCRRQFLPWVVSFLAFALLIFLYWLFGQYSQAPELYQEVAGLSGLVSAFDRLSTNAGIASEVLTGKRAVRFPPQIGVRPLTDFFFLGALFYLLRYGNTKTFKFFLLFLSAGALLMVLTPFSLTVYPHRMMLFYIFLPLLSGVALARSWPLAREFRKHSIFHLTASLGVIVLFSLSLFGQVSLTQEVIRRIRVSGGTGVWSDASYRIASELKQGQKRRIICLGWEARRTLIVLTGGEIAIEGIEDFEDFDREILSGAFREASFVTFADDYFWYGTDAGIFEELVRMSGRQPILERTFPQRNGEAVYLLYRIGPKGGGPQI